MRTIESPGVEINETDLSLTTQLPVGTTVFAVGYAAQGPTDEPVNVTSNSELEEFYGLPTNAAERYFYNTCKQVLAANGTLMVTRLPYGSGSGDGYSNNYSALVYPVFSYSNDFTNYTMASASVATISTLINPATGSNQFSGAINFFALNSANYLLITDVTTVIVSGVGLSTTASAYNGNVWFSVSAGVLVASDPNWVGTFVQTATGMADDTYAWSVSTNYGTLTAGQFVVSYNYNQATSVNSIPAFSESSDYIIGQPYHTSINESVYLQWLQGGINWKDIVPAGTTSDQIAALTGIGYAGMVIINKAKTAIDDLFAGYYLAITDNSKTDKGSNFDSISKIKTIGTGVGPIEWLDLNTDRLAFSLTGSFDAHQGSISEIVETIPSWDFSNEGKGGYSDSIILAAFKVRPSLYNAEDRFLDKVLAESFIGSFDSTRTINNPRGGAALNFYLEDVVNTSSATMRMFINPNISERAGYWFDPITNAPIKTIRVMCGERSNTNSTQPTDPPQPYGKAEIMFDLVGADSYMEEADAMYGVGEYVPCNVTGRKLIGNLPYKLERALTLLENRELWRVDIVPEAGLGTVWTGMILDMNNWPAAATNRYAFDQTNQTFDDTVYINGILNSHTFDADSKGLYDQETGSASEASDLYETVYNIFNNFTQYTRKDCLYIADPLRYIFVQGPGDIKILDDRTKNFSQHIYWPLKNLYGGANSSYACTYSNWFKINDIASGKFVWVPPSGWAARLMIQTDTNFFPWYAPAGLTRGILNDLVDIGINPTQKQRDLLYKIGQNPTVYWPGDGYVVWGQKTLQKKPSAFDRINVRRLFLWLEKATLAIARYFVFEQNTVFTRSRLRIALAPIFDFAKSNEGVYDYLIVCDERNNTPDVIDRNELVVDIYIKPVRVAEFILINFIATRTGQDFNELI